MDGSRLEKLVSDKKDFFLKVVEQVKFWETPLSPDSLLKMMDEILRQYGVELVFKDIDQYKQAKGQYNTNLANPLRGKDLLYAVEVCMRGELNVEDFETNFVDQVAAACQTTKKFKNVLSRDVLLYDAEEKDGFLLLKLVVVQIRCEDDYDEFVREVKYRLEEKYGTIITYFRKFKPVFYLEKEMLGPTDITLLEKKKEKIVPLGKWAYYLPADWIRYPIKDSLIPQEVRSKWLTVYHPLCGFDFSSYGNINVCDDLGPNRYETELADFPLDQGVFVSPRLNYLLGLNQHEVNHLQPNHVKHQKDDYYYAIAFECFVNQDRLRVPSIFKQKQKYIDKCIYADYYLINSPTDLVLKAILLKRFSTDAFMHFGQVDKKSNNPKNYFTVKGFESTIDFINQSVGNNDSMQQMEEIRNLMAPRIQRPKFVKPQL